jgi:hypothetical protein
VSSDVVLNTVDVRVVSSGVVLDCSSIEHLSESTRNGP